MGNKVNIALLQMKGSQDANENIKRSLEWIQKAAKDGAQIICLQELFKSLYFPQTEDAKHFELAETIPGVTTEILSEVAKNNKVTILASIFEKRTQGIYHNSALVIHPDGSLGQVYRKMHIPDDPGFYEKFYFTPGDLGFMSHSTQSAELGLLICWDQWFPEAARITALLGAQILFYPTAIGYATNEDSKIVEQQKSAWETIQRSHAIANGTFVASVNRVGKEGDLKFWGSSFISDPFGNIMVKASAEKEEILMATCDLSLIEETRQSWPFLRDRRIGAYQDIHTRYLK